jgi:regulatory protein
LRDTKEYRRLWAKAIQALARREHSRYELVVKLESRTEEPDVVTQLVVNLVNDDYLNDERFCEMLCRSRFNKGVGPIRLRHELNQHEIDSVLIETYLGQYDQQWLDRLIEIRTKKYGEDKPADYKEWSKQARFLQQRGFSSEHIRLAINRAK